MLVASPVEAETDRERAFRRTREMQEEQRRKMLEWETEQRLRELEEAQRRAEVKPAPPVRRRMTDAEIEAWRRAEQRQAQERETERQATIDFNFKTIAGAVERGEVVPQEWLEWLKKVGRLAKAGDPSYKPHYNTASKLYRELKARQGDPAIP